MAHFEADFSTLRQRERTTARSHTKTQLIWMVVLSVLYVPSMVSVMLLRRGPDQDRSRAILPRGLLRALTEGTRWESPIRKKCRNDVVLATMSSAPTTAMTAWPWRRSDRTFRARDLDLLRTLSGRLRRWLRGALGSRGGRARRRAEGLRRWGPIVHIHTRPTVAGGRSERATGTVTEAPQILFFSGRTGWEKGYSA